MRFALKSCATVLAAAALIAIGTAAQAKPPKVVAQIPVDKDFSVIPVKFTGYGPAYTLAIDFRRDSNGIALFCGAIYYQDAQARSFLRKNLRSQTLIINGKTVIKDFTYFQRANTLRLLNSSPANCASTGVKANAIKKVEYGGGGETFRN